MEGKLKPLMSVISICIFLLLAAASVGPDGSTNTTVAIKDCESKPEYDGTFSIRIFMVDKLGNGIPDAKGTIYITHQKVKPDNTCTYTATFQTLNFTTNIIGGYVYVGEVFIHDNINDLYRVEVFGDSGVAPGGGTPFLFDSWRAATTKYYNQDLFDFDIKIFRPLRIQ